MKLLSFSQFVNEGLGILNTGTEGVGNVSKNDNIFPMTPKRRLKRRIKGSNADILSSSDTQPPLANPGSYVNRLLQ
jgi:hypothetical protein